MPIDADVHGLENLSRSWNPRSMRADPNGAALLDVINACVADALNPLIDLELYAPIILNPTRCLGGDVTAVLAMNGVEYLRSFSPEQARRLAVIAQSLRSWRGAFRSLRSVVGAMTGGPVILRSWLSQRASLDQSSWDLVIFIEDGYQDTTQVFLLGQNNPEFDETEVEESVKSLARTMLDITEYVPCFTLSAWRDGLAGWQIVGRITLISSRVIGEYESVDLGPQVDGSGTSHRMTAPSEHDDDASRLWVVVWFKTSEATDASTWMLMVASDGESPATCYAVKVHVGNGTLEMVTLDAGSETSIGTHPFTISDGNDGSWHRLDLLMVRTATSARFRVYIDHDPSVWMEDVALVPIGTKVEISVDDSTFPTGRLRIAAMTAKQQD